MSQSTDKKIKWVDMIVSEPKKVSDYYSAVFGYSQKPCIEDESHTSYSLVDSDGNEVLGICDAAVFPNWVGGWVLYMEVDDFEASVAKVESSGGEIVNRFEWSESGPKKRYCLTKDPSGAGVMIVEK